MGGYSDPGYMDDVTEYGEDGLVGELPTLNTARYGAACGAVGQVSAAQYHCNHKTHFGLFTIEFHFTACLHIVSLPLV